MANRQTRVKGTPSGRAGDPSAPERWLANIRMSSFTIMIMVLVVLGVIVLAPSLKLLIEQRSQISSLEKSVDAAKQHVSGLRTQVARWNDPAYIEAQARNRLLFVFPGDYSYLVIPDKTATTTQDGAPISRHIQNTQVDWVKSLTASIFSAGLSDEPANKLGSGSGTIVSPSTGSPTSSRSTGGASSPASTRSTGGSTSSAGTTSTRPNNPGMTGAGQ